MTEGDPPLKMVGTRGGDMKNWMQQRGWGAETQSNDL